MRPGVRPERRDRQVQRARGRDERVREDEAHERRKRELHDRHESEIGLDFADRRPPVADRCGNFSSRIVTMAAASRTGT